jgi:hypothetical protein
MPQRKEGTPPEANGRGASENDSDNAGRQPASAKIAEVPNLATRAPAEKAGRAMPSRHEPRRQARLSDFSAFGSVELLARQGAS